MQIRTLNKDTLARDKTGTFRQVFDEYWQGLFMYAFNVTKSKETAEDIVQEIFTQLWQQLDTVDIHTSLKGYLYTATHYRILRELRTNRHIPIDEAGLEQRLRQESPEAVLTLKDLQQQIALAVNALPDKCRQIYHLSREKQYTHKEIASQLGISPKTVEAQLTIALRRIRRQLRSSGLLKIFLPLI